MKMKHKYYEVSPSNMHFGKTHIWINPTLMSFNMDIIKDRAQSKVHLFITKTYIEYVNDELPSIIHSVFADPDSHPVLVIHIPHSMPDFKKVVEYMVAQLEFGPINEDKPPRIRIVAERNGADFLIPRTPNMYLHFMYSEKKLYVSSDVSITEFGDYDRNFRGFGGKPGVFKNVIQSWYPEVFKDQLIQRFKESTPPGILKTFKTEDEMWDFMLQRGEWDPKGDK